ncbi:MAG: hypothetical protein R3E39_10805 [Anaerolineae bacterium]
MSDLIGTDGWATNLDTGTITFGGNYQFPIQVLGTESEQAGTWLWANDESNVP